MKSATPHLFLFTFLYYIGLFESRELEVNFLRRTPPSRSLQNIKFRGSDPGFTLSQCEGDCDTDADCSGSLVCFQKSAGGAGVVPGCSPDKDTTNNDYCVEPADLNTPPNSPPTSPPSIINPTPAPPTPRDSSGTALYSYGSDPPSDVFPLGVCEGDCDTDRDCSGNLICLQRGKNDGPVPGCSGNDNSRTDYCIASNASPIASPTPAPPTGPSASSGLQNFKLKLYWEQGYFWQEETFERKWCMRCRGGSCSLGEKLYIEECDDSGVQRFDFDDFGSDEILIRLHGTSRCLERSNKDIFVRNCDSGKSNQLWWAKVGGFDEYRFEISQKSATNLCVTQRHHPKPDEEVELEPCTQARVGETSFWERCYTNTC